MTKYRVIEVLLADGSIGYSYEYSKRILFWDLWVRGGMVSRHRGEIVGYIGQFGEGEMVKKLWNVE